MRAGLTVFYASGDVAVALGLARLAERDERIEHFGQAVAPDAAEAGREGLGSDRPALAGEERTHQAELIGQGLRPGLLAFGRLRCGDYQLALRRAGRDAGLQ